jgi:DNA polymerase-3 subunit alpha
MRGPARGSGGGSLLLYSLDITTLDPIKYELIFERFLSDERSVDVVYDYFGEAI